jgi:Protein of unknown function (DUF3276)
LLYQKHFYLCEAHFKQFKSLKKYKVAYENNDDKKQESVYSARVKAGKRRTYFFDIRETRGNDYYLTITESRKRFDSDGYDRHKIFVYKEDFNKFAKALNETVEYVKTDLMPDFDFDAFNHDTPYEGDAANNQDATAAPTQEALVAEAQSVESIETVETAPVAEVNDAPVDNGSNEVVDKW